jgi:G3E family GTPase
MTKIDIVSGFLGAGKTTLIRKLLKDALAGTKVVLIENEFGEIGIDGGFLKESGIEIREMNSGCICCSLVGDFGTSLREVMATYAPERILIEPSGVGKLSEVMAAVSGAAEDTQMELNSAVAVVDGSKAKLYIKNFGEFFIDQIEHAGTIILTRTDKMTDAKIDEAVALLREHNEKATIITTPLADLDGKMVLETIEGRSDLQAQILAEVMADRDDDDDEDEHEHHHHHHHDDDDEDEHEHHHHHDDDDDEDEHEHHHHHHDDDDDEDEDEHHHHHHHDDDDDEDEHEHHHHHHDDDDDEDDHEHHHHHDHDHHSEVEVDEDGNRIYHSDSHDHHHHHHHHHHHGHDADEVFQSWGMETPKKYTIEEVEAILARFNENDDYGIVLRSKGMVPAVDGTWIHFDFVPDETEVRTGAPDVTGKICVIGSGLKEAALADLWRNK